MTPWITLTTDYGQSSPYVAAMKGAALSVNPDARLLDLSHSVPPQGVRHASFFLGQAVPYFPPGTVHVAVVDPGVGTGRALLLAEAGGQLLLGPDNGCLSGALRALGGAAAVRRLTESRFWRQEVSSTFHGRDVFAPVAARLSLGTPPAEFGPPADSWVEFPPAEPVKMSDGWVGQVAFADDYGNLLTNLTAAEVTAEPAQIFVGGSEVGAVRLVRTYADGAPDELVMLFGSGGLLEIACVNGSAARRLSAGAGAEVRLVMSPAG